MKTHPRMKRLRIKRTLLTVLLLLAYAVGGAIINVAVAWGYWIPEVCEAPATLADRIKAINSLSGNELNHYWDRWAEPYMAYDLAVGSRTSVGWADRVTIHGRVFEHSSQERRDNARGYLMVDLIEQGWPLRSILGVEGSVSYFGNSSFSLYGSVLKGAVRSRNIRLGLIPLWPGFAINTIFYAAILWLLFTAPGFVRRRIRARRGQCPACAYPVGASDVCTECGRPVKNGQLAMGNRK